jgi:hypothetical protein
MLRWLTTILARLTKRGPSGPPPRLGWNGRPWAGATKDSLSPGQEAPASAYSTLIVSAPRGGPAPTGTPAPPAE